MKVVVAIDSFKESITSLEAGYSVKEGVERVDENIEVEVFPLADGGEGTVEALTIGLGGEFVEVEVIGPLLDKVTAKYGILQDKKTAIMEMSQASGIMLVDKKLRNPLNTTTFGVGEMIKDAIDRGYRNFIIGIGGSATNDGGVGMLMSLGYNFLDKNGEKVPLGAIGLKELHTIDTSNVLLELKECNFRIACDVVNPLCGENGCSRVFAPQKGATEEMIVNMDSWLENYAKLTKEINTNSDINIKGTGAAGGLGFAFLNYTNAVLESGIDIILDVINLREHIKDADFVVTGEGKLDFQTSMGKLPVGVAKMAKEYDLPVIAFSGVVTDDAKECNSKGIDAFFPILRNISTLEEAINKENTKKNLKDTVEQVFRLLELK